MTLTMPLSAGVCHPYAMVNLHVKPEVSTFTGYEYMEDDAECT